MIKVFPGQLNGVVPGTPNEDEALRVILMAAFADQQTSIFNMPDNKAIETCYRCIKALGAKIENCKDHIVIYPAPFPIYGDFSDISFAGCETLFKLLLAFCGAKGIDADFSGATAFDRELTLPMTTRLAVGGMVFSSLSTPYKTSGRLKGGLYVFTDKDNIKDVGAILCALPFCADDSTVRFAGIYGLENYVRFMVYTMGLFGIKYEKLDDGYHIRGGQRFRSPGYVAIENDWRIAYFWLVTSIISGSKVAVTGLTKKSEQRLSNEKESLPLLGFQIQEYEIDCQNYQRLAIPIAIMLMMKGSNISIKNVGSLRHKEVDIISALQKIARQFGQVIKLDGDNINLYSVGPAKYEENMVVSDYNEPWIFISLIAASAIASKPYIIDSPKGYTKKHKEFLKEFISLGGKIEVI